MVRKSEEYLASIGAPLAPPPDDLDILMSVEEPVEELQALGSLTEAPEVNMAGMGRLIDQMTSLDPGIRAKHPQGVGHVGVPKKTLYSVNGEPRQVPHTDVPMLVDGSIPSAKRLYIRCPLCAKISPGFGFHKFAGPNFCPGKPRLKWSACPICRNHGIEHRVFEDESFDPAPKNLDVDEDYVAPRLPDNIERSERLQDKLDLHMTTFHSGEAYRLFGLQRIQVGNSFMVVKKDSGTVQQAPSALEVKN